MTLLGGRGSPEVPREIPIGPRPYSSCRRLPRHFRNCTPLSSHAM